MKYITMIKISIKRSLAFKYNIVLDIIISIINIIILQNFWTFIYSENKEKIVFMTKYVLIGEIISSCYSFKTPERIIKSIKTGLIEIDLIRPWNCILAYYFEEIGSLIVNIVFKSIPLFFIFSLINKNSILSMKDFLILILGIFLGIIILFSVRFMAILSTFWFNEALSILILTDIVIKVFSGKFIPSWLMPTFFNNIFKFLPFIWIYQKQIELVISSKSKLSSELVINFGIISLWGIILILLLNYIWYKKVLKKVSINGG